MIRKHFISSDLTIGIDLGTGSMKIVVLDAGNTLLTSVSAGYPTEFPNPGWSQQNPDDWATALLAAMQSLAKNAWFHPGHVRRIGICGAAHIPVLLDKNDRPTCPSILWNDCRSGREVEELDRFLGERILERTANRVGCTWTLPQLLWLSRHRPDAIKKTVTFLTSKDYLVYLLTGCKVCDRGSAAATMAYDNRTGEWAPDLIDAIGMPTTVFPMVCESGRVVGHTTRQAEKFGFTQGIPVVAGCLDSVAEMIGAGLRNENDFVVRLGTAGAILALSRDERYTPGLFTYPFPYNGLFIKQAGTSCCGKSIEWVESITGVPAGRHAPALSIRPGADGLFFHPFLQGERAPYNNPDLKGSFIGLSTSHGKDHLLRAVLEGVSFSLRDCIESVPAFAEMPDRVRVVGGGTRSKAWMSILANILGRTLLPMEHADSAFGAGILASKFDNGVGMTDEPVEKRSIEPLEITPEPSAVKRYTKLFERYAEIAGFLDTFYRKGCHLSSMPATT